MAALHAAFSGLLAGEAVVRLAVALAVLSMMHTALGLARSRQGYLLPVVFGLTGLAGFLLNPLADANSLIDLKARLLNADTLILLCAIQLLLVVLSAAVAVRLEGGGQSDLAAIALGVLAVIPTPLLLAAMLLVEQAALATAIDARPEAVGRWVGLGCGALLALAAALGMRLSDRWLSGPHHVLSATLALACMFIPLLEEALPQPMDVVDWESLKLLAWIAPGVLVLVAAGFAWKTPSPVPLVCWEKQETRSA